MSLSTTAERIVAVKAHLESKWLIPLDSWLQAFLSTQKPTTSITSIQQTAVFRILASDIKTTLAPTTSAFPANITDTSVRERQLAGTVIAQVLDIEDVSKSRWEQIEAIEAIERGEFTKGREVIRVVPGEQNENVDTRSERRGPYKVLLQDVKGALTYGVEVEHVNGLEVGMNIGSKLALRNAVVARGLLLLEPQTTTFLGGKIERLHDAWKTSRKNNLLAALRSNASQG